MRARWFDSTPALDQSIRERFEPLLRRAAVGELDAWLETPEGALALVVVLDQLPLNMYRGRAEAYATGARAVAAASRAIADGHDRHIPRDRLAFLYLPFMHSEDMADQDRSVALFRAADLTASLYWAEHHRGIVARYGRFPHRNAALDRASTPEELAYLASPEAFKG
jgi:uncharacterized protein (DUF924 family)